MKHCENTGDVSSLNNIELMKRSHGTTWTIVVLVTNGVNRKSPTLENRYEPRRKSCWSFIGVGVVRRYITIVSLVHRKRPKDNGVPNRKKEVATHFAGIKCFASRRAESPPEGCE